MATRPNLLFIWTDEQRADTLTCYGNDYLQTPNLDRLAAQSAVFEYAYCTQPVCTPSRASIMTGLYPHTHGVTTNNLPLPKQTPTIAELAGDQFDTANFGKWHLGDELMPQRGFRDWLSIEDGIYRPFYSDPAQLELRSDYHHFLIARGFVPDAVAADGARVFSRSFTAGLAEQYTKAGFVGRRAASYLRQRDPSRPFLMSINFLEPHMPFFGPLNDRYAPEDLPVGPAFGVAPGPEMSLRNRLTAANYRHHGHGGMALTSEWGWRRVRANYCGLVTMVDNAVGQILTALDDSGQADNTIIVFTSDHGDMMGDHGILAKTVMYEESVRIPLLVSVPGQAGRTIRGRVSQIDLLPTLLALLDCERPDHLQGHSRADIITGGGDLTANEVVVEWNGSAGAVRQPPPGFSDADAQQVMNQQWRTLLSADGWKLNCADHDRRELFDLNHDPHELCNRVDDVDQQQRVAAMTGRLAAWQERHGDTASLGA